METYIDPDAYRVDPNFDHQAHMERYPIVPPPDRGIDPVEEDAANDEEQREAA